MLSLICLLLTGTPTDPSPTEDFQVHVRRALATLDRIQKLQENIQANQSYPNRDRRQEEVASSHWAYAVCVQLQQHALIPGYRDISFTGKSLLTRGEFSAVTRRALDMYLEATSDYRGDGEYMFPPPMTLAQMDLVSRLFTEFRSELAYMGTDTKRVQVLLVERRRKRIATADERFVMAARHGNLPLLKSELDAGIVADSPVFEGMNALQAAVYEDDEATVSLLLERGANPRNGLKMARARLLKVLKILQEAIAKEHHTP